ncbi:MAG: lipoprotein [Pseudomonadota bacterium]
MKKSIVNLVYFIAALSLVACGQMGPLYLPDQKPPIYVPHSSAKSVH